MRIPHFTSLALSLASLLAFAVVPGLSAQNTVYSAVQGSLVKASGRGVESCDASSLQDARYIAIYFSASWCPPCRAFTPSLVSWYNRNKAANPHFELIFVSSDETAADMANYMKAYNMEWPALAFNRRNVGALVRYKGSAIPCLVLIDESGTVLSHSFVGGTYVGPQKVLRDIARILEENPATAPKRATAASPAMARSAAPQTGRGTDARIGTGEGATAVTVDKAGGTGAAAARWILSKSLGPQLFAPGQ
ncbi:thioredoxin-like domain-containing protein [Roseimicrobium sp. ORNL1]|uniref:thioredoxin-like domain-containing protein n=1 Tax=Roseimicrobium sp. ORNL1 TaxID=2711231 RepID=UPI0013E120D8|nr:thioredoxin-like domain-containing protein [Roseimicrobium sp. ORNL1]QIF02566.1 redoxin domain-containing protein [Roseimicrobium sp. ORNL1]